MDRTSNLIRFADSLFQITDGFVKVPKCSLDFTSVVLTIMMPMLFVMFMLFMMPMIMVTVVMAVVIVFTVVVLTVIVVLMVRAFDHLVCALPDSVCKIAKPRFV